MFATEKELVSFIRPCVESDSIWLQGGRRTVFAELDLGYGIADLVAVSHNDTASIRKNSLEYFDISLLSLIQSEEKFSFEQIVYITKSPERKIHSALLTLMEDNFISFRKGYYFSHNKYADVLTDSIAIEAKLKDWRRALKQAYRYKWFADKSFVFLPLENIAVPMANVSLFERYNVGLASVSKTEGIEVVHAPYAETPISRPMRIALNEHLIFSDNSYTRST